MVKPLSQLESLIISDGKQQVGKQFWAETDEFVAVLLFIFLSRLRVKVLSFGGQVSAYSVHDVVAESLVVMKVEVLSLFGSMWDFTLSRRPTTF